MLDVDSPYRIGTRSVDIFRFLDVEEPLAIRAEAMVCASLQKSRRHCRGGKSWTTEDESLFLSRLCELYEARVRLLRHYAA